MGGGGGFFAPIINTVGSVVNAVSHAVGGGVAIETPEITEAKRQGEERAREQERIVAEQQRALAAAKADSDTRLQADAMSTEKVALTGAQEGGTPTAQAPKQANAGFAAGQSQQAVNQSAGSGTLLTGLQGVDLQSLELGKKTLLGG